MEIIEGSIKADSIKVGVVTSRFNWKVCEKLEGAALTYLKELGFTSESIVAVRVAGAFEIPLAAKQLLEAGCDGVVALGAVIRGDTSHYDFVCNAVERGCTQLQLEYNKPVSCGVLTTENAEQAFARAGGVKGNKGMEAAQVCLEMIDLKRRILPN